MKQSFLIVALLALSLVLGACHSMHHSEGGCMQHQMMNAKAEAVTLESLVAPVQAIVKKETEGGKIQKLEKLSCGEKCTCYRAELEVQGKLYQIMIAEDGTLLCKRLAMGEKGCPMMEKKECVPAKGGCCLMANPGEKINPEKIPNTLDAK